MDVYQVSYLVGIFSLYRGAGLGQSFYANTSNSDLKAE